jgi:putative molybdopterin biosynthesis protein
MVELMSTRAVARYLGINEKKIYFLAKTGKIPCTRVTGKWTFPRRLIDQWIEESASEVLQSRSKPEERSFLLAAGSDDPALGLLRNLYDEQTKPASLFVSAVGSSAGLTALRDGIADFATAHLFDPVSGEYNLAFVKSRLGGAAVVVQLFYRELGLVMRSGNPKKIYSIGDLARSKLRMINRQAGSGTRLHLDRELTRLRIDVRKIAGYENSVSTHVEVGLCVLRDEADVGLATETTARLLGLDFIPLARERFDVLVPKERFFARGIQTLLGVIGAREFRERVEAMGGYDASESGRIISKN